MSDIAPNGDVPDDVNVPFDNAPNNSAPLTKHPPCAATAENGNCAAYPGTTSSPNATSWSDVTQIIEPGDAWTGSTVDKFCSTDPRAPGTPSLLTVENDHLWLYQGGCENSLNQSPPVELGSSGWSNMTLIAPGMVNGNLALWARDNTSGDLYSYTFTPDADGIPTLAQINAGQTGSPITAEGAAATLIPLNVSLTANSFPVIATNGDDATGSTPSLYFIGTAGNVWELPGISGGSSSTVPLNPNKIQIGMTPPGSTTELS